MRALATLLLFATIAAAQEEKAVIGRSMYDGSSTYGSTFTLNSTSLKYDMAFMVTKDITVTKVNFKTGSPTGSPVMTVQLESDNAGRPSGTVLGSTNNAKATGLTPASGWQTEITLGETATLVRGTLYHLTVALTSGTSFTVLDQNNSWSFSSGYGMKGISQSWTASYNGSVWSNRNGPIFVLKSNDGTPVLIGQPMDTTGIQTMNATTGYGVQFTAPIGGQINAFMFSHLPNTGTTTITGKLYDNSGTLLGTATLPTAVYTINGNVRQSHYMTLDDGPVSITAGSTYCVLFRDAGSADRLEWVSSPSSPDYRSVSPNTYSFSWASGTGTCTPTTGKIPTGFSIIMTQIAKVATATETLSASNSAVANRGLNGAATETLSPSDSAATQRVIHATVSESLSPSDSASVIRAVFAASSFSGSPSDVAATQRAMNGAASETLSASDAASTLRAATRAPPAESLNPSDAAATQRAMQAVASESLSPGDDPSAVRGVFAASSFSASPSDSVVAEGSGGSKFGDVTETLSPSDSASTLRAMHGTASFTASPSDSPVTQRAMHADGSFSASPSDAADTMREMHAEASISLSESDSVSRLRGAFGLASFSATPVDAAGTQRVMHAEAVTTLSFLDTAYLAKWALLKMFPFSVPERIFTYQQLPVFTYGGGERVFYVP